MGVSAHEDRPVDAVLPAVEADRLGGGEDVGLVECGLEGRAAVTGSAEGDPRGRPANPLTVIAAPLVAVADVSTDLSS